MESNKNIESKSLSVEETEKVSGGVTGIQCPKCGSRNMKHVFGNPYVDFKCPDCGYEY